MLEIDKKKILIVALISEAFLFLIYVGYVFFKQKQLFLLPTWEDFSLGLLATIPLLVFNYILFGPLADNYNFLGGFKIFRDNYVLPLASSLDRKSALLVSLLAGFGEELFFRGVLQVEFGIVLASICFAFVHFGTAVTKHFFVFAVYVLVGFYFGMLFNYKASLCLVITTHSTYDFLAILLFKKIAKKQHQHYTDGYTA